MSDLLTFVPYCWTMTPINLYEVTSRDRSGENRC